MSRVEARSDIAAARPAPRPEERPALGEPVIRVESLRKTYGATVAVDDVSFEVRRGEIFGIVGPNGAGKTTTVECLMGLRRPDQASLEVLGLAPDRNRRELSQRIGVQLQQANLPDRIRVWEALDLFSSFYRKTVPWEPLLERWGLTKKRNAAFAKLSGGQKQRLFVALALLNDPEIVFLDEITTGLDPQARRETWELVRAVRNEGKTVVLVTHYMDEVEALCDRVAIIDGGRVIALDTPQRLVRGLDGETRVIFRAEAPLDPARLDQVEGVRDVSRDGDRFSVAGSGPLLVKLVLALHELGHTPTDIHVQTTSLEDVFLSLTGRTLRD